MTIKRTTTLAAAALAVLLLAAGALVGGSAIAGHKTTVAPILPGFEDVNFVSLCRFSHRKSDDPIVFPGQSGFSHDHMFFGNTTTDANSTPTKLRGERTTCSPTSDTAAYWTPTLLVDNKVVEALDGAFYYRRNTIAPVKPFPANLVMIAGDSKATQPQSTSIVFWNCSLAATNPSQSVPNCGSSSLRLHVIFPECWDGKSLDSPDHKSHMAYAANGVCPKSHPVAVPQLVQIYRYPVNGAGKVEVASQGQYSGHADFVNAWDEDALTYLVNYCLNAFRPCGPLR
jgi:uncharacterized protein DUF1996